MEGDVRCEGTERTGKRQRARGGAVLDGKRVMEPQARREDVPRDAGVSHSVSPSGRVRLN